MTELINPRYQNNSDLVAQVESINYTNKLVSIQIYNNRMSIKNTVLTPLPLIRLPNSIEHPFLVRITCI